MGAREQGREFLTIGAAVDSRWEAGRSQKEADEVEEEGGARSF